MTGAGMMDPQTQLESLLNLLSRLGVEVRRERLGGTGGGLCRLRDRRVFFLDLDLDRAGQLEAGVAAVAAFSEVDTLYLTPALREQVDRVRGPAT